MSRKKTIQGKALLNPIVNHLIIYYLIEVG
jgi:hypothetical protein